MAVMGWESMVQRAWIPLVTKNEWWYLGALIGGIMLLTRWFKPIQWISRIPLGFMMGVAAGLSAGAPSIRSSGGRSSPPCR